MIYGMVAWTALVIGLSLWHDALLGWRPGGHRKALERLVPFVDKERERAALLGVPFRLWAGARLTLAVAAIWFGVLSGIPVLMAIAVLVGIYGLPWAIADVLLTRRIQMTDELIIVLESVADRVERGGVLFDVALRDVARNPEWHLRTLFTPLVAADSVLDALGEAIASTRFALAQRFYVILVACLARSTEAAVRTLRAEVRHLRREVERLSEMQSIKAAHRVTIAIIGLVILFVFWLTDRQPEMNVLDRTLAGQVLLVVALGVFALSAAAMNRLSQLREPLEWDVRRARQVFRTMRRG